MDYDVAKKRLVNFQNNVGRWSKLWASRLISWHAHIVRDPNFSPARQLLGVRRPDELQARRWLWHRPRTRAQPGFTCTRWAESIDSARVYIM